MSNDYYYSAKTRTLACVLEEDVVEFKDRNEDPDDVDIHVIFQDLTRNRIFIQEASEFDEEFLIFTLDEIPMLQEWYGMDDLTFARLKKMVVELLEIEV